MKLLAEFFGSAFLLMVIVGSGIMGESLAQGNLAVALLANSLASAAGLYVLIQCLGPISGAHFNPIVSLVETLRGKLNATNLLAYVFAQTLGGIAGVWLTHAMFHQAIFQLSSKNRNEPHLWLAELIASFGLISAISLAERKNPESVPGTVALYILAAYWFTASTSFANPAVTIARSMTESFSGIQPQGIGPFLVMQTIGATLSYILLKRLPVHQQNLQAKKTSIL